VASIALALIVVLLVPAPTLAGTACDPFQTTPTYRGTTPTAEDVLGFPLGSREVSSGESDEYLDAVDDASAMVTTGTAATSVEGRPLRYALVGRPANVSPSGLQTLRASIAALRDPSTPESQAASLAASTPAILLVQANVHGSEESGTDASLQVLYDLADRTDCAAARILDNAVVLLLPIQNPDGREADTRRNANGFDMNRDWFARTQPETDGKLELLRQYPPVLDMDVHEMGAFDYFFPPNSDPTYHEVPDVAKGWIDDLYGAAMSAEFDRQGIKYFHYEPYDFFGAYFGDTVPTLAFHAAGMTFEKSNGDPVEQRVYEQYVTMWTSLSAAADNRVQILRDWHDSFVEAYQEGVDGRLEPNAIFQPEHALEQQVPSRRVRHYFILPSGKPYERAVLARRLQRMDVDVYRLTAPLRVRDFRPYGDAPRDTVLPVGTYWIPMAQAQKHWIQTLLHEDTYIPWHVTYDVSAWSNPLLLNLEGGSSGLELQPAASLLAPVAEPSPPAPPSHAPTIGVFQIPVSSPAIESAGATRYLLDGWSLPYRDLTATDIRAGALADVDVLIVPDGYANYGLQALGAKGKKAIVSFVNGGGRYVGWVGGAEIATRIGVSTAVLQVAHTNMPGSLVRARTDPTSPLTAGVGPDAWIMFEDDPMMSAGLGTAVVRYPAASASDFDVSGLAVGAAHLGGTAAVVDERVGAGRSIVFASDPAFRVWTLGTARILRNAVVGPDPAVTATIRATARTDAVAAAKAAAQRLPAAPDAFRLMVPRSDATATMSVLGSFGAHWEVRGNRRSVIFFVANPRGLAAEEHPFIGSAVERLLGAGVRLRAGLG
jgi:hypothetical protein